MGKYEVISTGEIKTMLESMLHPLYFKKIVEDSVSKLSGDECYSLRTRNEFLNYDVNIDDISYTYQFVRDVIGKFKGEENSFTRSFINVYLVKKLFSEIYQEDPRFFMDLK